MPSVWPIACRRYDCPDVSRAKDASKPLQLMNHPAANAGGSQPILELAIKAAEACHLEEVIVRLLLNLGTPIPAPSTAQ